jgi:D-xylose transport system permease protein
MCRRRFHEVNRSFQNPTSGRPDKEGSSNVSSLFSRLRHSNAGALSILAALLMIAVVFQTLNSNFLTPRNLSNLVLQIGVVGTLGTGVVLALLLGEIDLSLGAVAGVAAAILGVLVGRCGWVGFPAILIALLAGAAMGCLQGAIVALIGVPSFIATMAGLLAWQGLQLILLGSTGEILIRDPLVRSLASGYLSPLQGVAAGLVAFALITAVTWRRRELRRRAGLDFSPLRRTLVELAIWAGGLAVALTACNSYFGVPYILLILGAVVAVLMWFTERTVMGRHIYAIGGNLEAARRSGIPIAQVRIRVFALIGMLSGLGGALSASRQFAVSIGTGGGTLLLDAIAAAVIGGTSLFGGRGRIYHALIGALVIGSVANGLDLLGEPSSIKNIATGVILVIAVGIDALSRNRRQVR